MRGMGGWGDVGDGRMEGWGDEGDGWMEGWGDGGMRGMRTSWGGTSKEMVRRSTLTNLSMQGMMANMPGCHVNNYRLSTC